jgi:hypothetical protein
MGNTVPRWDDADGQIAAARADRGGVIFGVTFSWESRKAIRISTLGANRGSHSVCPRH